jgi:transcriptional regulator with XRE-family HTH domain
MRAKAITPKVLSTVLRTMRTNAGLTQRELADRTQALPSHLRRLIATQVSGYERGNSLPSVLTFVSMVIACSADGKTLNFSLVQEALEGVTDVDGAVGLRSHVATLRRDLSEVGDGLREVEGLLAEIAKDGIRERPELTALWERLT